MRKVIRKSFILKIGVIAFFTLIMFFLMFLLINKGRTDPEAIAQTLKYDSFADFIISNIGGIFAAGIIGILIIAIIRTAFFSQRFRGPVYKFRDAIQKIEDGNLDTILDPSKNSEYFSMVEDFNQMIYSIDKRFKNIKKAIKYLEKTKDKLSEVTPENEKENSSIQKCKNDLEKYILKIKENLQNMTLLPGERIPRVLVIGGGGREHTICAMACRSRLVDVVYASPGNAGIDQIATIADIDMKPPFYNLIEFVKNENIDLTIVGPEQPLVDGITDIFRKNDLVIFGPSKKGAKIEGSKAYAKHIMEKYGIPTGAYSEFNNFDEACSYLKETTAPYVIKADGLAAGKGVVITSDTNEAINTLRSFMLEDKFGSAGKKVIIEEYLDGEEASILAFVDQNTIKPLPASQDHKRAYENDEGPNTGGMGAYAPAPVVTPELMEKIQNQILDPMLKAFKKEGIDYRGILYAGLIIKDNEIKVIEFNCRFGDPETQAVLPLLKTDLIEIIWNTANNQLDKIKIEHLDKSAICVVLASGGYPGSYEKGKPISGIDTENENIEIFHAGTSKDEEGNFITSGGRVLGVTAVNDTLKKAVKNAYSAISSIEFEGMHFRKDIAQRALKNQSTGENFPWKLPRKKTK